MFTKEFLDLFQERVEGLDVVGYVMMSEKISFQRAIEKVSEFLMIKPEYCEKGKSIITKEDKLYLL